MNIRAEFVNFIEHKERVSDTHLTDGFKNATRHGANIGAPVPANFSFVAHATQRTSYKLASHCFGD